MLFTRDNYRPSNCGRHIWLNISLAFVVIKDARLYPQVVIFVGTVHLKAHRQSFFLGKKVHRRMVWGQKLYNLPYRDPVPIQFTKITFIRTYSNIYMYLSFLTICM